MECQSFDASSVAGLRPRGSKSITRPGLPQRIRQNRRTYALGTVEQQSKGLARRNYHTVTSLRLL